MRVRDIYPRAWMSSHLRLDEPPNLLPECMSARVESQDNTNRRDGREAKRLEVEAQR